MQVCPLCVIRYITAAMRDVRLVPIADVNEIAALDSAGMKLDIVQLLLGHTKIESTVRYLGIEVDDALAVSSRSTSEN